MPLGCTKFCRHYKEYLYEITFTIIIINLRSRPIFKFEGVKLFQKSSNIAFYGVKENKLEIDFDLFS